MITDPVWIAIIANTILVAFSIVNAWMIAWYNKKQGKKKKTPKQESDLEKKYWKIDFLAAIVFLAAIASLVFSMFFPNANSNVQAFHIAINIGYAVLAIVFYFLGYLMRAISGHTKLIGNLTDLMGEMTTAMGEMTSVIAEVGKIASKESPNPTVDPDAHKSDARGSP